MALLFSDFYHVHRSYYREDSICLFGGSFQDLVTLYFWKSDHKWTISAKLQTLVLMQNSKNKLNWPWDIHPPSVHYHQVQEKTCQQVTQLTSQLQAWTFVFLSSSHLDLSAFDCTLQFTWMIKWLDLQTAALNQPISRRTTQRVLWNPMEINSNKIIIIETIVGFMIKKTTKCNSKLLFIFSTKTYGLGTQKNHLNGKVLLSTQNKCKNWCQISFPQF